MERMRLLDVVRLVGDRPADNLSAGMLGTIAEVFEGPTAYEVEFVGDDGRMIALVTLAPHEVRPA